MIEEEQEQEEEEEQEEEQEGSDRQFYTCAWSAIITPMQQGKR